MKNLVVLLLSFGLLFSFTAAYASGMKVGYVDFEKAFNQYNKTKTEDAQLKAQLKEKQKELEKKTIAVSKMRDELALLTDKAKQKKQEEIRGKIKELKKLQADTRKKLLEERNKEWMSIYKDIKSVVADYGKAKGYTFIFDEKALIYGDEVNNLTNDIIKILNKK